jgi:catechol 2,3-dioxygenase-like lactoylglutathione lyase family enzyme
VGEPPSGQAPSAAERGLAIRRLDHFTVPVRDFHVSCKFYTEVLGGIITGEPDWEPFLAGRSAGSHMSIKLFQEAGRLVLYWQPWGHPEPDQVHPHRAFTVANAEQLAELLRRLQQAEVPWILVTPVAARPGEPVRISAYFRDPDMNQLEVVCPAYPFGAEVRVGTFDPAALCYPWSEWRRLVPDGGAPNRPRLKREGT